MQLFLSGMVRELGYFDNQKNVERDFAQISERILELTLALQKVSDVQKIPSAWLEISEISKARVKSNLKVRMQDAAIKRARQSVQSKGIPFGRFIEAVRAGAGLTRIEIAERLGKTEQYLQRLERGDLSPIQLPVIEFVEIVELFHLRLPLVTEMVVASTQTAETKQTFRAAARSHGGIRHDARGEDVERALDAFAHKMQKRAKSAAEVPQEIRVFISKIEGELKRRGRSDLLT